MAEAGVVNLWGRSSPEDTTSCGYSVGPWGYRSYRQHLADRFGPLHIRKLCLDAGFTCPNLDGTIARGGCAYCTNAGFVPSHTEPQRHAGTGRGSAEDLRRQWDRGRRWLRRRHRRADGFIAYFQAYTNTHAPLARLRALYDAVPDAYPECVGLSISTRPDCLDGDVVDHLAAVGARTFLTVELGLQSDRDAVLAGLNRGHDAAAFTAAVARCAGRGFELCAHVMLGLPGEGDDAPERLGALLASLPVQSVKIHNLHIMRGTALAAPFRTGLLAVPDRARWLDLARRCIARLRPDQAVQRLVADAPATVLLSDPWCQDKQAFLRAFRGSTTDAVPSRLA